MSTLEKTINLLNALPKNQIETIYSFVQFLSSQQTKEMPGSEREGYKGYRLCYEESIYKNTVVYAS